MFATAFNDRFFTYTYPQRLGGGDRLVRRSCAPTAAATCSRPGARSPTPTAACPATPTARRGRPTETYGLPLVPGRRRRCSSFVGREGYRDPACDFEDAPFDASTPHGAVDQRQTRLRPALRHLDRRARPPQVPEPALRRRRLGEDRRLGGLRAPSCPTTRPSPDSRLNRLWDGSVEPPFRIGMACGACHIAYDPLNPPADPDHPAWENIDALVGNQYSRVSNLLGNGLSPHRLEWQLIARARPGIVDTSALPMDFVSNPGTMNAIINFARRPTASRSEVLKWRKAATCEAGADPQRLLVRAGPRGQVLGAQREDRGGAAHPEGRRGLDRLRRGDPAGLLQHRLLRRAVLGQPPDRPARRRSRAAQLRPDAVRHRPVPARLRLVPGDRGPARRPPRLLPDGAADRPLAGARPRLAARPRGDARRRVSSRARSSAGREVFADDLRPLPFEPAGAVRRPSTSWRPTRPTRRCGSTGSATTRWCRPPRSAPTRRGRCTRTTCRAGSGPSTPRSTPHARPADPLRPEVMKGGGRGYYRNISLLSAWAHAPFMHNNAIGPEICGKPADAALDFYSSPYVDARGQAARRPAGLPGLRPERRGALRALRGVDGGAARTRTGGSRRCSCSTSDIVIDIAPEVELLGRDLGLTLTIPAGFPAVDVNSLRYKDLIQDLVLVGRDPAKFETEVRDAADRAAAPGAARGARGDPGGAARDGVALGDRAGARARGGGGRAGAGPDAAGRQRLRAALLLERARARRERRAPSSARA